MIDVFFHDFLMELVPVFLEMQTRGVKIDPWRRETLRTKYAEEQAAAAQRLEAAAGFPVMAKKTIGSKALIHLLYTVMKLPKQFHHKTHRLTADKRALDKLAARVGDEQIQLFGDILTVRDFGVLISTFLDARLDDDCRLRWSHNLAGTVSGRISTSASPFYTGTNIQNWEETVREIVIADPGYLLVYADGEQAEARVVAFLSQDPALIDLFNNGINVHKQMASKLFGMQMDQVDKGSQAYADAKTAVHAAHYKVGPRTAAIIMRKSEAQARKILENYFSLFPGVKSLFHGVVEEKLRRQRMLFTPFGRWRQFFGRMDDDLIRQGISYIPQSTVADWLDMGLLRLSRLLHGSLTYPHNNQLSKWLQQRAVPGLIPSTLYPSIQIHDGLACFVHYSQIREAVAYIRQALTFPIPFDIGPLTIPIDIKIGFRWGSLKSINSFNLDSLAKGQYQDLLDLEAA